jgi:ribosomal protein S27E
VTERTSDGLPLSLDSKTVTWDPWETSFVPSHLDISCDGCGHPGPSRISKGRVMVPLSPRLRARWQVERMESPLIRFWAFRCPGCQETRVYDKVPPEPAEDRMPMIEYMRPVIAMAQEPSPKTGARRETYSAADCLDHRPHRHDH